MGDLFQAVEQCLRLVVGREDFPERLDLRLHNERLLHP